MKQFKLLVIFMAALLSAMSLGQTPQWGDPFYLWGGFDISNGSANPDFEGTASYDYSDTGFGGTTYDYIYEFTSGWDPDLVRLATTMDIDAGPMPSWFDDFATGDLTFSYSWDVHYVPKDPGYFRAYYGSAFVLKVPVRHYGKLHVYGDIAGHGGGYAPSTEVAAQAAIDEFSEAIGFSGPDFSFHYQEIGATGDPFFVSSEFVYVVMVADEIDEYHGTMTVTSPAMHVEAGVIGGTYGEWYPWWSVWPSGASADVQWYLIFDQFPTIEETN